MTSKKKVILVSADKEILESIDKAQCDIIGFIDPKVKSSVLGIPYLGEDEDWGSIRREFPEAKILLVVDVPERRSALWNEYGEQNLENFMSPSAFVSDSVKIGLGHILQDGAKIYASSVIGKSLKMNVNSVVHHDCRVGDFCTLAPGSQLLGNVQIGNRVYIGAGAIVLPRVVLGDGVIVGAGAVVTKNIEKGTVAGVPAKPIRSSL